MPATTSLPVDLFSNKPAPTSMAALPSKADGFASLGRPGGTTGGKGKNSTKVPVRNAKEFLDAICMEGPCIIKVKGKIDLKGMHKVASDKTIIGVGNKAAIVGGGIKIGPDVSNVIVQNIRFADSNDDAITIVKSKNVWIDHCDFRNATDGLVDIKKESDNVTVSWNHFSNHKKTCLLGHNDDHTADVGKLRVTYHHNWFDGTKGRHPRVRFSKLAHVYNNYYLDNKGYGVASTCEANVLVENNYFEGVDLPTRVTQELSPAGNLDPSVISSNQFIDCGTPETRGPALERPLYDYMSPMHDANKVKNKVKKGAGPSAGSWKRLLALATPLVVWGAINRFVCLS